MLTPGEALSIRDPFRGFYSPLFISEAGSLVPQGGLELYIPKMTLDF